jgi:hypothetical protein
MIAKSLVVIVARGTAPHCSRDRPISHPNDKRVGPQSLPHECAGPCCRGSACPRLFGAATVVDSSGEARAMLTANGADGSHVFVAQLKALTAATFKMPSAEMLSRSRRWRPASRRVCS